MFEYFCWASNGKIEIMEVKNQEFFLFVNETSTIFHFSWLPGHS